MARSERFDHFTAAKHTPGAEQSEPAKAHHPAHKPEHSPNGHSHHGTPEIHYGHKFAQTEEKLHQRAIEHRQAEQLEKEKEAVKAAASTAPIGSVPAPEVAPAPAAFPSPALLSVWSEAQRTAQEALRSGKAALAAVYKLGTLPLEAAKVVAHDVEGFFSLSRS